jgi:hypothetical protein
MFVGLGITNIIVNSSILESLRIWIESKSILLGQLINCMLCTGFWVGLLVGLIYGESPVFMASLVSLLGFIFSRLLEYFDLVLAIHAKTFDNNNEDEEDDENEKK